MNLHNDIIFIHDQIYILVPSSVQNVLVTLVGNTINITWSPPSITNGMILQYIVQRINSSGKSYYYVSGNHVYLELPYFNDALVFVSAVNQYGQSSFVQALSSGKKTISSYVAVDVHTVRTYFSVICSMYVFSHYNTAPCLPSPCINNGTCVIMNVTHHYCVCVDLFFGDFCEFSQKVSTEKINNT